MKLTILGNPVPKERPRVYGRHAVTPSRTQEAENWIKFSARKEGFNPLSGLVRMELRFFRSNAVPADIDNLAKLVQDALNGIAYLDDRQIVYLAVTKAIDRDNPRTEIEVVPETVREGITRRIDLALRERSDPEESQDTHCDGCTCPEANLNATMHVEGEWK